MAKTGRPKKNLEDMEFNGWDQLDALIVWASEEYCAEKLGISVDTLARKLKQKGYSFAEYRRKRREPMLINLLKKQYETAMQGNVTMLIWLGKQYLGQAENSLMGDDSLKEIEVKITKHGKDNT